MKKILICLLAAQVLLVLASCGYNEGIVQKADKSYLKFTGHWQNATVQIDDSQPFELKAITEKGVEGENTQSPSKMLYEVSPGRHNLKIYREGRLVVNRIMILENRATREVMIP